MKVCLLGHGQITKAYTPEGNDCSPAAQQPSSLGCLWLQRWPKWLCLQTKLLPVNHGSTLPSHRSLHCSVPQFPQDWEENDCRESLHAHRQGKPGMLSTQACIFSRRDVYHFPPRRLGVDVINLVIFAILWGQATSESPRHYVYPTLFLPRPLS